MPSPSEVSTSSPPSTSTRKPRSTTTAAGIATGPAGTTPSHAHNRPKIEAEVRYLSSPSASSSASASTSTGNDQSLPPPLPSSLSLLPPSLLNEEEGRGWVPIISAPAYAPLSSWHEVMDDLILHPERNSSNILRAEILSERSYHHEEEEVEAATSSNPTSQAAAAAEGGGKYVLRKAVRRRILPRRPGLDWEMEQECRLYHLLRPHSDDGDGDGGGGDGSDGDGQRGIQEATVIYTPLLSPSVRQRFKPEAWIEDEHGRTFPSSSETVPFYHPKVRALAFRFFPSPASASTTTTTRTRTTGMGEAANQDDEHDDADDNDKGKPRRYGLHAIYLIPFSNDAAAGVAAASSVDGTTHPLGPSHRLSRTSLRLLTTLHLHTWGRTHSYTKRVYHDILLPRSTFQDLYLDLKSRYASSLLASWVERTDPKKHVFEDLGIAAFLILLWRKWWGDDTKGPRGGFVDVGCGNGLLVYLLNAEGFKGHGFDLRSRKSWDVYRPVAQLREVTFDPRRLVQRLLDGDDAHPTDDQEDDDETTSLFPPGCFLIGNHADELTPWLPLVATALGVTTGCSGLLNLPCCPYLPSGLKFSATRHAIPRSRVAQCLGLASVEEDEERVEATLATLRRGPSIAAAGTAGGGGGGGGDGGESRNIAYLHFLSLWQLECGWNVEKEALRIPSTKNWALVGRSLLFQPAGERGEADKRLEDEVRARCLLALQNAASWSPRAFVEGSAAGKH